jgi:anti-sigma factor ChrR (cupin superfamily)
VQPQKVGWRSTKFDGVEVKPLYIDRDTGLVTVLMKMAPGAVLPDHEHVGIEQTFVLEGELEDLECTVV